MFDLESEKGYQYAQKIRLLEKLEGYGQVTFNNSLYLCGNHQLYPAEETSFLFRYDSNKHGVSSTVLQNSKFHHYNPTLIFFQNHYLVVVGGKNTRKNEVFNNITRKWQRLEDLPEERYGCCLYSEDNSQYIYLFGGQTKEIKKKEYFFNETILRLKMLKKAPWEILSVKTQSNDLIKQCFSACIELKKGVISIFGGITSNVEATKRILNYNYETEYLEAMTKEMKVPGFFQITSSLEYKNSHFLLDDQSNIHKFTLKAKEKCELDIQCFAFIPQNFLLD